MVYKYDFLIIGAGVAGMSYALKVARGLKEKGVTAKDQPRKIGRAHV